MTIETSGRGRLFVIIPALNEAETIADVVANCRRELCDTVVVINDGSNDDTASMARSAGADVIDHPFNLGVGAAVRTGLTYAVTHGATEVLVVDADGQHDGAQARALLVALRTAEADIVVGSRFASGYTVGLSRRFVMRRLSAVVSKRLGTTINDTTSGFRAFGPRALAVLPKRYPTEYLSDTVETLLIAGQLGLRVCEVDIEMNTRQGGKPSQSSVGSVYHLARMFTVVLSHAFTTAGKKSHNV